MALLKEYFSMYISDKTLNTKYKSKVNRKRSAKRIFIGRGDLKHTSNKVIITFYVHNTEKISLKNSFLNLYKTLYAPKKKKYVTYNNRRILSYLNKPLIRFMTLNKYNNIIKDTYGNEIITYNRPLTIEEFMVLPKNIPTKIKKTDSNLSVIDTTDVKENEIKEQITFYDAYFFVLESFINETSIYLKELNNYYGYLNKLVENKIISNSEKFLIFIKIANNFYTYRYPNFTYYKSIADRSYKKNLYRLRYLLLLNSIKFEKPFNTKLIHLIEKLYGKKIEFNIVNLKKVHLSSDILTQAIVLKTRMRKNNIYSILRSSLNKANLPNVSRITERRNDFNKSEYFLNEIRNSYINNMFNKEIKGDSLNNLLLNYFP